MNKTIRELQKYKATLYSRLVMAKTVKEKSALRLKILRVINNLIKEERKVQDYE